MVPKRDHEGCQENNTAEVESEGKLFRVIQNLYLGRQEGAKLGGELKEGVIYLDISHCDG